jgi:hypothetical protein
VSPGVFFSCSRICTFFSVRELARNFRARSCFFLRLLSTTQPHPLIA